MNPTTIKDIIQAAIAEQEPITITEENQKKITIINTTRMQTIELEVQ